MRKTVVTGLLLAVISVVAMLMFPQTSQAQGKPLRNKADYITGEIVPVGGRFMGRTRSFTINVSGYTTKEESAQMTEALQSGGQDRLLSLFGKMDKGTLAVGPHVGIPISAILAQPTETGTKLTILYRRTVRFFELRYGTRSEDYRFGYIELYLDRNGKGEGTMIPAAQLSLNKDGTLKVDEFGEFPARLIGVRLSH